MERSRHSAGGTTLTVVLVHDAFANLSSWNGAISILQESSCAVLAVTNPLRGLARDAAYVASAVRQIDGPVLLAGHGYGGMVIANAASAADNVIGLVAIAALIPAEGESAMDLLTRFSETLLGPTLRPRSFPGERGENAVEMLLDPLLFRTAFAADLPAREAAALAAAQRPIALAGLEERSGAPGWRWLPCWSMVATEDRIIAPDGQLFMSQRAGATIVDVAASHAAPISQPGAVAALLIAAMSRLATGTRG